MKDATPVTRSLQLVTARFSIAWLVAANAVGIWLAALLIWPTLGTGLGEFTYGRWMPLHMDWQLYGWCSLPLVGLLLRFFLGETETGPSDARLGLWAWSLGLLSLGVTSLDGVTSGKLFLNWAGPSRVIFPAAQLLLWCILVGHSYRRWRVKRHWDAVQSLQAVVLAVLLASPISLWITAGRNVYPPVDPTSGGATGHSLLASSLGILFIFGLLPHMLGVSRRGDRRRVSVAYWIAMAASWTVWAFLDHGNASNTDIRQVVGLGVLLCWIPLIEYYLVSFQWTRPALRWLRAFIIWWGFLTISGFISFLPQYLDILKFTNALVAHAHLAMAGMLTSLNMLILLSLGPSDSRDPWSDRRSFWAWQVGCALYVVAMLFQGAREGLHPEVLFEPNTLTQTLYSVRLAAGCLMFGASARWLMLLKTSRQPSPARVNAYHPFSLHEEPTPSLAKR